MKAVFRVGEEVAWIGNARSKPLICTVVRVMPEEHAVRGYRIRGGAEGFERSVSEDSLSKVPKPGK